MVRFLRRRIGRKLALALVTVALVVCAAAVIATGGQVTQREVVLIGITVLGGLIVTGIVLRQLVLRPLGRLGVLMNRAREGDYLVRAQVKSDDEIGELARTFNVMLAKITDMTVAQIDDERERVQMRREVELKGQLEARVRELTLLMDTAQGIVSTLELDEVLDNITRQVGATLGFDECSLLLYEADREEYVIQATYGFSETMQEEVQGLRFDQTEGIISMVHADQKTVYVPDTANDARYMHYKGKRQDDGSLMVIPMAVRGKRVGALAIKRPEIDAFSESDQHLLEAVASQAALAITNARLYEETVQLATIDPLTGLFNRRRLGERLAMELDRAARFDHPLSVVMVDVDHFKPYNDTHGHPMGDVVLRRVAEILAESVRSVDTVARYGGEEFTVLLPRLAAEDALGVAEKLRQAVFETDFEGGETQPLGRLSLSLGIASFPVDARDAAGLFEKADEALYAAKEGGRNRTCARGVPASRMTAEG